MPRAKAILQSEFPYNISARCINQEWFNIPMNVVWEIFCEELTHTSNVHKLIVHSFVLMSNHYHLIASTPEANISQCMQQFNCRTSKKLTPEIESTRHLLVAITNVFFNTQIII
jgi:putative transposase